MRATPKVMSPILLGWSIMSEVDIDGVAVDTEPSHQYSIKFCCWVTDDSKRTLWQNDIRYGSV